MTHRIQAAIVLLAAGVAAFGQETVPFDSDMVIRSTTNLVQVRVVAEDPRADPCPICSARISKSRTTVSRSRSRSSPPIAARRPASNPSANQPSDSAEAPAGIR